MTSHPSLQKYVDIIIPSFSYTAKTVTQELTRYSESRKADHAAHAARARAESSGQDNAPDPAPRSTPLSTAADNRSPLVQAVQRAGFPEWGYVIFRTDYSDEARWDRFQEIVFDEMCDVQMSKESETGLQAVKDKLSSKPVEDPALAGASVADVKRCVLFLSLSSTDSLVWGVLIIELGTARQ
jgi:hypothetical protein